MLEMGPGASHPVPPHHQITGPHLLQPSPVRKNSWCYGTRIVNWCEWGMVRYLFSWWYLFFTPAPEHLPDHHIFFDRSYTLYRLTIHRTLIIWWGNLLESLKQWTSIPYSVLTRSRVAIPHQRRNSKTKFQGVSTRFSKLFWSTILS